MAEARTKFDREVLLLDAGTFTILGHPLATVIAEKLSTALDAIAAHQRITLRPLSSSITDLPHQRQPTYAA
ncbi:hypothetical protein [Kribbella sp. NPDC004875]|uniref:hypothetical protein n=1 Tax=Kribbella sp. NPDC004875 TaxID=3364107 RepID=UPI0036A07294